MRRIILLLLALFAFACFARDRQGKGKPAKAHKVVVVHPHAFLPEHHTVIVSYYRGLPHGLARRDDLPPGLERQLRRNGTLPPGLRKKLVRFPDELAVRLPVVPAYVQRGIIGHFAVVWDTRTHVILDVFLMKLD